ncbi:MAG: hypothetical protein M3258_02020 [Thermoproteota archaeon]|nr:hypothetical protein [Thermoproteota archaeon]
MLAYQGNVSSQQLGFATTLSQLGKKEKEIGKLSYCCCIYKITTTTLRLVLETGRNNQDLLRLCKDTYAGGTLQTSRGKVLSRLTEDTS